MEIRLATPTDLPTAAKIISEAFLKQAVARIDRPTVTTAELKNHLSDKQTELFLMDSVGAALMTIQKTQVYIWCVSILPAFQGQGLGIQLMEYMEKQAVTIHHKKGAVVTVVYHPDHPQEPLIQWYEAQGYKYTRDLTAPNKTQFWQPKYHPKLHLKEFIKQLT